MRKFFEWDAGRYNLQIPQVDHEHRAIVDCMNRLHELHEARASTSSLAPALEKLVQVTVDHFAEEEAYMERIGFVGRAQHAVIHQQLLGRIQDFHQEFRASGAFTEAFFHFLKLWLRAHICGIDTKYAAHARTVAAA